MSPYPTDHAGLEILSFDRCLALLATVPVGRVGFLADGEIVVLPVNYLMDGPDPVSGRPADQSYPRPKATTWWRSRPITTTSGPSWDGASW